MTTAAEAVRNFLQAKLRKGEHKGPDLVERYLKLSGEACAMETQVNVSAGDGELFPGKRSTYTDGIDTWFSYRIPKNADTEPFFKDYPLKFPLDIHCDGIGSTGWDWVHRRSRWVGFDFDSIAGHAAGIGVDKAELDRVRAEAQKLPYVTVRRSTGGSGLHLYVFLEDDEAFNTANHTEHAAVARAIIGIMSKDAGYSFNATVDACGGNMWLWHRKSAGTEGLALLKEGEVFTADMLPLDWRDHIPVVNRSQARVRIGSVADEELDPFELLVSAHRRINLDDCHKAVIEEFIRMGYVANWVSDHHLLQAHTRAFADLLENKEAFTERTGIELHGVFQTNSQGKHRGEANCFAFPTENGGWRIVRFGQGTNESPTWEQDGQGWTTCWYNVRPNMDIAARSLGGRPCNKGYQFDSLREAVEVARMLNPEAKIDVDPKLEDRSAVVSRTRDGHIAIEVPKKGNGEDRPEGLWNDADKKTAWTHIYNISAEPEKLEVTDYDEMIRRLENPDGTQAGWVVKKRNGEWTKVPVSELKMHLQHIGHPKPEAEMIIGKYTNQPWKVVSLPFQPEYPGNRQWNKDAPQYRFQPAPRSDSDEGEDSMHPHWDMVLNHVGADLDEYIKELEWAKLVGIRDGGAYLRAIFASILREPEQPTPYLFLFGPENSGKSILHEAFELLVTGGCVKADRALTSSANFNGELALAILGIVEETDLSKSSGALNKIKDYVTSRKISIRKMRTDSYMAVNMTHWIQTANSPDYCPIIDGDTRITMIYVERPDTDIPKGQLLQNLEEEAPHFMRTLMDMQLPPPTGRLRIPVVKTGHKENAEVRNRNSLEQFLADVIYQVPGELILFSDFYTRFIEYLPVEEKSHWSRIKVSRQLPMQYQTGTGSGNKSYVINASFEQLEITPETQPYYVVGGKIKKQNKSEKK